METKPLLKINQIQNVWFNGDIKDDNNCPSIGQFFQYIEKHKHLNGEDKKSLALHHLKGPAKLFANNCSLEWKSFKKELFNKFKCELSLKEKIDLRKHLIQQENENCIEFHKRCVKYQFLLWDDQQNSVFERDILISFVCGLKENIYEKLMIEEEFSALDTCVKIATKIEQNLIKNSKNIVNHKSGENEYTFVKKLKEEIEVTPQISELQNSDFKIETTPNYLSFDAGPDSDIENDIKEKNKIEDASNKIHLKDGKKEESTKIERPKRKRCFKKTFVDISDNETDNEKDSDFEPSWQELITLEQKNSTNEKSKPTGSLKLNYDFSNR